MDAHADVAAAASVDVGSAAQYKRASTCIRARFLRLVFSRFPFFLSSGNNNNI